MLESPSFYYIIEPVADMRAAPERKAEMVSQTLFSEQVRLLDESKEWIKIETAIDQYQGWTERKNLCGRKQPLPSLFVTVARLAAHVYGEADTIYGPILTLPFESRLSLVDDDGISRWIKVALPDGREVYVQRGDVKTEHRILTRSEMCRLSTFFLGLPYTWGGRSSFGYDCSGFVQMLYRQMGVFIPRDSAQQQAWRGFAKASIDQLDSGDLVFFGFSPDQICHVGLWLGEKTFIHAVAVTENAPYVRISSIEDAAWNGSGYYPFIAGRKIISN